MSAERLRGAESVSGSKRATNEPEREAGHSEVGMRVTPDVANNPLFKEAMAEVFAQLGIDVTEPPPKIVVDDAAQAWASSRHEPK